MMGISTFTFRSVGCVCDHVTLFRHAVMLAVSRSREKLAVLVRLFSVQCNLVFTDF